MKLYNLFVTAALATAQIFGQGTQIPSASISYPTVTVPTIHMLTPTGSVLVQLHPSIVLDTSGPVPMLRAISPPAPARRVEVFKQATAYTTVTMSKPADTNQLIQVWRNGLLMAPGIDYTVSLQVITFTLQPTAVGDIVQVQYATP